jgi:hypothetical protein
MSYYRNFSFAYNDNRCIILNRIFEDKLLSDSIFVVKQGRKMSGEEKIHHCPKAFSKTMLVSQDARGVCDHFIDLFPITFFERRV